MVLTDITSELLSLKMNINELFKDSDEVPNDDIDKLFLSNKIEESITNLSLFFRKIPEIEKEFSKLRDNYISNLKNGRT